MKRTRGQWVRRKLASYAYILLAVNFTAGWARLVMGDEMHEPAIFSLARPFVAALFFWIAVERLIEDNTVREEKP